MRLVHLPPNALRAIREHAAATYPDECCGALLGAPGSNGTTRVTEAFPLPNTTHEGARRRFFVRPSDYLTAESRARAAGAELVGFYHSHPDHPARPSDWERGRICPRPENFNCSMVEGRRSCIPGPGVPSSGFTRIPVDAIINGCVSLTVEHCAPCVGKQIPLRKSG
jgi:proteasome lid subunit RPN8/RPN11